MPATLAALLLLAFAPAVPAATAPPAPPAVACLAQVVPVLRWPGGFQATVILTNNGAAPMHAWYVAWQLPAGVHLTEVWNGIAMVSGPTAMVHAPSWHSPLAPGATISAGLLATGDPPAAPPAVQCG